MDVRICHIIAHVKKAHHFNAMTFKLISNVTLALERVFCIRIEIGKHKTRLKEVPHDRLRIKWKKQTNKR